MTADVPHWVPEIIGTLREFEENPSKPPIRLITLPSERMLSTNLRSRTEGLLVRETQGANGYVFRSVRNRYGWPTGCLNHPVVQFLQQFMGAEIALSSSAVTLTISWRGLRLLAQCEAKPPLIMPSFS
jgi:hypothetical protein